MIPSPTIRVLVVEDYAVLRRLVSQVLESTGYTVVEATDGEQGIECFREHSDEIDLILTDVVMPTLSGTEMVRKVLEVNPSMRIIFMTGTCANAGLRNMEGKNFPVLEKPFTVQQLTNTVHECLAICA